MTQLDPWDAAKVEGFVQWLIEELDREKKPSMATRQIVEFVKEWLRREQIEYLQKNEVSYEPEET